MRPECSFSASLKIIISAEGAEGGSAYYEVAVAEEMLVSAPEMATVRLQMAHALPVRGWLARGFLAAGVVVTLLGAGCEDKGKLSADRAAKHVEHLAAVASEDVEEVRRGLPRGAEYLSQAYSSDAEIGKDPQLARAALEAARAKTQDLRVAKSSFFALLAPNGEVIRSEMDPDLLAGRNVFSAFPGLKQASGGTYVEAVGSMHEARGVEGKPDGQWIAAQPIKADNEIIGVYATGWAWSVYARRLEHALRGHVLDTEKEGPEPLLYVFIVAEGKAYGTAAAPEVNAQSIEKLSPLSLTQGDESVTRVLEITGREFGLAMKRVPKLGEQVLIAVLRSET